MTAKRELRPAICIVGPGRLGSALAVNLHGAGWRVAKLVVRQGTGKIRQHRELGRRVGASVEKLGQAGFGGGLVWITVPDDRIPEAVQQLAAQQKSWRGVTVFHSSGALSSEVLEPLRARGAQVASVHPGMTFVAKSVPSLSGVPFGIEGDAGALRLARRVIASTGAVAVTIRKEKKVLYHAFDTFASPLLIALMATLEEVGRAAGIPRAKLRTMAGPLLTRTLENYLKHGAAEAFSGPFVRGDLAVIGRHLEALQGEPHSREAYVALARVAAKHLPVENRAAIRKLLEEAD